MAKTLSKDDILHLAKLAGLNLDDKEIEKYQTQLIETLEYIENLQQLDVTKKDTSTSPVKSENVFFEDGEKNSRNLSLAQVFRNVKNKKGSFFKVRKIF